MELRYEYNDDGSLKRTSAVDQTAAEWSTYGPEKYVVEYEYDSVGRVARKVVRDTPSDDDSTRFEVDYTYDRRGQLIRERIWRYDVVSEMMLVTQDIRTSYDLGRNPTEIRFSDNSGWAYTETRTYARGHQLIGFSTSNATGVTVTTSGSYTYDDNNNLLTTKKLLVIRGASATLASREAWEFTYDNKNRLKSYTNAAPTASGNVGNIWYDGRGRVWQRWVYDSGEEEWAGNLTRYVYDGSAYAQEHNFTVAEDEGAWVYTYDQILTDYLRKPGGVRQRDISTVDQSEADQFLLSDSGSVSARIQRETNSLVQRVELSASGTCQASGSQQDTTISKLGLRGGYTETFSGSTEFDPLVQMGGRHYLAGLGRIVNMFLLNSSIDQSSNATNSPLAIRCWKCEHPWYSSSCMGRYLGTTCWREDPDSDFDCKVDDTCSDCNGIQCPSDIGLYDCYDVNLVSPSQSMPSSLCMIKSTAKKCIDQNNGEQNTNGQSNMEWFFGIITIIENTIYSNPRCIMDDLLKKCVRDLRDNAWRIYCNCDSGYSSACTSCGLDANNNYGYICIEKDRILNKFYSTLNSFPRNFNIDEYFAAILFHEWVHYCLHCRFKRPMDQQALITSACGKSCFPDIYLFGEGNYGHLPSDENDPGFNRFTNLDCKICPSNVIREEIIKHPETMPATLPSGTALL